MEDSQIIEIYEQGVDAVIALVKGMQAAFQAEITALNNRITELEARLNKNSNNSSKPPSTDNYKKKISNRREKTGKPTGGQPGHEGTTLLKIDNPDEIIEIKIEQCNCGCDLSHVEGILKTRQVFELPKIKLNVTEYRTYEVQCPDCHKVHASEFPDTVTQPVQYGENFQALMEYFVDYQLIPLERTTEIMEDIIGQKISQGTLINVEERLNKNLENFESEIKQQIIASKVVNFDETGMRVEGKTKWVHSASTETLTHYAVHDKRGSDATKEIGILSNFTGTSVHDHWKPYYTFAECTHAECNAHIIRNLKGIYENHGQEWAQEMTGLLVEIKRAIDDFKEQKTAAMPSELINEYVKKYDNIIAKGKDEDALKSAGLVQKKIGKPKKSEARKLLERLEEFNIETLAFMYDFDIPFDNNLAERDLRMVKLRQKISGCFRSKEKAKSFCRIRSYISTCRKNGQNILEAIKKAIKGEPFIPLELT